MLKTPPSARLLLRSVRLLPYSSLHFTFTSKCVCVCVYWWKTKLSLRKNERYLSIYQVIGSALWLTKKNSRRNWSWMKFHFAGFWKAYRSKRFGFKFARDSQLPWPCCGWKTSYKSWDSILFTGSIYDMSTLLAVSLFFYAFPYCIFIEYSTRCDFYVISWKERLEDKDILPLDIPAY